MSKPPLSISFHNFYASFDPHSSGYVRYLQPRFDVKVEKAGKDIQVSAPFGRDLLPSVPGKRPLRVFHTGEVRDPFGQVFDIHFGFAPRSILGPRRWFRFPLWIGHIEWSDPEAEAFVGRLTGPRVARERPRFCNFIYSNDTSIRAEFFFRLDRERPVDSLGAVLNNRGARAPLDGGKRAVLRDSQFTIAFENQIADGYVTEKLIDPLIAGSIPIYWGAREALTDFNPDAFIYAPDFPDLDSLVRHVLAVADDRERREALQTAPVFRDGKVPYEHTPDFFVDRLVEAMSSDLVLGIPASWGQTPFLPRNSEDPSRRFGRWLKGVRRWILGRLGLRR